MHTTVSPAVRRAVATLTFISMVLVAAAASAGTLNGKVTDGPTGTPIPDATVRVAGGSAATTTDDRGRFELELPPGSYDLVVSAQIGGESYRTRLVRQHVPQYKPARAHLYTDAFLPPSGPTGPAPGLPTSRRPSAPQTPQTDVTLPIDDGQRQLTLPEMPDTTIRVARRQSPDEGCSNNPIVAIEEMDLETYVRGVLPPEIGVFRNLDGVRAVYRAFALAAKSYGLWFRLHYDASNRRTVANSKPPNGFTWFHIDDTACNQRYSDNRLSITNNAASDVTGKILVRESDPREIHKYEYAASCGHHGTRPAYQQSLVSDQPPATACVGDWCGHETCAGHEDNPNHPGDDRCLVRGMCQWGAAEWAKAGRDYRWILDHYQPNLLIRPVDNPPAVTVTGYVYTDPTDIEGSGVPDARVRIDTGASTRTDADGLFTFEDVPLSENSVRLTARKSGYEPGARNKQLVAGERNWASIRLRVIDDTGDAGSGSGDSGLPTDAGHSEAENGGTSFGPLVSPARRDVADAGCGTAGVTIPRLAYIGCLFVFAAWYRRRTST